MKNLYLLFGFALMGVLFFACQKDESVVEEIQGIELESTERSPWADPYIFDFTDCIDDGGCPCRLINLNQSGSGASIVDVCMEQWHYLWDASWTYGQGLNLHGINSLFNRNPGGGWSTCNIPMNNCDPSYAGGPGMLFELYSSDTWNPGSSDAEHPYFAYEGVIPFCFIPQGYISICNPLATIAEWHLVCELDTDPSMWETFFIAPNTCRLFYVGSNCSVEECTY